MKYLIVILVCLMLSGCSAQESVPEPISQSISEPVPDTSDVVSVVLTLTPAEQKVILHYNETIEGFIQQVIEDRARQYIKDIVSVYREEDKEAVINALPLKTRIEIIAEEKAKEVKPIN